MEKSTNPKINKVNEKPVQEVIENKKQIPFSKEVYNKGIKPIVIKKTLRENIVLHPRKSMRFSNNIAEDLCEKYKDLEIK